MECIPVNDLVRDVRVLLDENRLETSYLQSDTDNMELDEIIHSNIVDAVRSVLTGAPSGMLEGVPLNIPEAAQYMETDGSGYVVLPPDFLRLLYFKMRSWRKGVYKAYPEASNIARMQTNLFTRGTPIKPICILSHDLNGSLTLEYYSVGFENNGTYNRRDHRIDRALYIPIPSIIAKDDVESIEFNRLLYPSIINYCAGLTCINRKDDKLAEIFFNLAKSYLNE